MEFRINRLADYLLRLHEGTSADSLTEEFKRTFGEITSDELAGAEQQLVERGIPVEEIQRLSTEHTRLASVSMIGRGFDEPGHPLTVFLGENRGFIEFIEKRLRLAMEDFAKEPERVLPDLQAMAEEFASIFLHYDRKENLFFPYLETAGITVPPMVMWGVDDVIRQLHQLWTQAMAAEPLNAARISLTAERTVTQAEEMVQKENDILVPMLKNTLSEDDWILCAQESDIIGYAFNQGIEGASISDARTWLKQKRGEDSRPAPAEADRISLPSGNLTPGELNAMLNTLPTDLTFVDKDDIIRYYSEGKHQVFTRTRTIIGRDLYLCHPPQLVPVIKKLIEEFRAGTKDGELVPMRRGNRLDLVRYYAVRDEDGEYLGTVEVTEEMSEIVDLLEGK